MLLYNYKIEMVQEVQQQGNWYQTPNRIQWIWVSERKVSDHTQVRNKWTNGCVATTSLIVTNATEAKSTSWTVTADNTVKYRAVWGKLYIPQAWTYLIKFVINIQYAWSYSEKFRIYNWKKEVYLYNTNSSDEVEHEILLDFGKKNDLSISLYMTGMQSYDVFTIKIPLQIIKL